MISHAVCCKISLYGVPQSWLPQTNLGIPRRLIKRKIFRNMLTLIENLPPSTFFHGI